MAVRIALSLAYKDRDGSVDRFDIVAIEKTLFDKKMSAGPGDLNFLVSHLRELPEDARKFVIWASFFGPM